MAFCTWVFLDIMHNRRVSALGAFTGSIVGLATITPGARYVRPASSLVFGAVGSIVGYYAIKLKEKLKYDDTLDVFACHGLGGAVGIFLTGLFAETAINPYGPNGSFFGNPVQIGLQVLVIVVTAATSAIMTAAILLLLKYLPGFGLAPSAEKEAFGMDFAAHREVSYRWDTEKGAHPPATNGNGHEKSAAGDVEGAHKKPENGDVEMKTPMQEQASNTKLITSE